MSGRPELLFPLFAELETLPGVGPKTAKLFPHIGIEAPRDLLFALPYAVVDRRRRATIAGADLPATMSVEVTIGAHRPPRNKGGAYRIHVEDAEADFQLVFFHARGDYLKKLAPTGSRRLVSGKVEFFDGMAQMVHPDHVVQPFEANEIPDFEPVYHLTQGVSQKLMTRAARGALQRAPELAEWIDASQKAEAGWPDWHDAVRAAHAPTGLADVAPEAKTRTRLAYDEFFAHQLTLALARRQARRPKGMQSVATGALQSKVLHSLPFRPTGAQMRAVAEISDDMASSARMNRLLQGDVGSGKTLVALMALLVAVEAGGEGVMMAPTEILARQHYEGLRPLAEQAGVVLELLTGRDQGGERRRKLSALGAGGIALLVGTRSVFQG
ncbi:MAG: DEAD/DEAH box helicase, partial [Arenibacterium sp.]